MRKKLAEILTYDGLKELYSDISGGIFNASVAWTAGKGINIVTRGHFNHDYNPVDHIVIGAGLGSIAYRMFDRGKRGAKAAVIATTAFNIGWEIAEAKLNIYGTKWDAVDTALDVFCVYAGFAVFGYLAEKGKTKLKAYIKKKDAYSKKWLI